MTTMLCVGSLHKKSKDISLHRVYARNTRESTRIVFRTDHYEGTLYQRSPYFVGSKLWNALPVSDIELPDIHKFRARFKRLVKKVRQFISLIIRLHTSNLTIIICFNYLSFIILIGDFSFLE